MHRKAQYFSVLLFFWAISNSLYAEKNAVFQLKTDSIFQTLENKELRLQPQKLKYLEDSILGQLTYKEQVILLYGKAKPLKRKGKLELAISLYQLALSKVSDPLKFNEDHPIRCKINIAQNQNLLERVSEAKATLYEALEMPCYRKSHYGMVYNELANILEPEGEYELANSFYKNSIHIFKEEGEFSRLPSVYINYSILLRTYMKDYELALSILNEALQIIETHGNKISNSENRRLKIYGALASTYDDMGEYEKAIEYSKLSENMVQSTSQDFHTIQRNLIKYLVKANKLDEAFVKAQELIKGNQANQNHLATAYINLGSVYEKREDWHKAIEYKQLGLRTFLGNYMDSIDMNATSWPIHQISDKKLLFDLLGNVNETTQLAFAKTGNQYFKELTIQYITEMDKLIDELRKYQSHNLSQYFWRSSVKPIYDAAIKFSLHSDNNLLAYEMLEKSRAVLLNDQLLLAEMRKNSAELDSLLIKKSNALKKILELEKSLDQNQKSDSLSNLLNKQRSQLIIINDSIHKIAPKVNFLNQPQAVSVENLQAYLAKTNASYIAYNWSDQLHRIVITPDQVDIEEITLTDSLIKAIQFVKLGWRQASVHSSDYDILKQQSAFIYRNIFPERLKASNLIISPDGALFGFPFAALNDLNTGQYLVAGHSLNTAYSAALQLSFEKSDRTNNLPNLIFAPTSYHSSLKLSPLLTNTESVQSKFQKKFHSISDSIPKDGFIDQISESNILYLSTHAGIDQVPWISLKNEKLSLSEITISPIESNLVVLSACETSLGKEVKGEGMMSLARGFTFAGAQSVMATFWKVNESSTAEIINSFYENLSKGQRKSEALRNAQLEYLQNAPKAKQHPYYWAGFQLYGSDEPIKFGSDKKPWLWILVGLAIAAATAAFSRKKQAA